MSSEHQRAGGGNVGLIFAWAVFLYFLPALIILVDELVLKTSWCARHLPEECGGILRIMYRPVAWVLRHFVNH